jgi:hypothetical protein
MRLFPLFICSILFSARLFPQTNYALTFFNSSNSYIVVPYTDTLQPKIALTVEAWINVNSWAGTPGIVGNTEFGGYELQIEQLGGVNRINFYVKRNGSYALASLSETAFGTGWHHVAGTYDGRFTRIYLDGVLQSSNDALELNIRSNMPTTMRSSSARKQVPVRARMGITLTDHWMRSASGTSLGRRTVSPRRRTVN